MALDTRIHTQVRSDFTSSLDLASVSVPFAYEFNKQLTNGTGSGSADKIWHDQRTITASATDSLDLAGVLVEPGTGATLTFVKIKVVMVKAADTNTNNVNVTRPASNGVPLFLAAGDGIPVLPGGQLVWIAPGAGVTVTASTGDLLDIVNSGGGTSVVYDICVIGTSA